MTFRRLRLTPSTLFFPAATLHAAIVLPWSVLGMAGIARAAASLSNSFGHAQEMLLGYTLAVVAGYQLPRVSAPRLWLLFGTWMLARLAFLAKAPAEASAVLNAAFAIVLAIHVAPRLLRAAKKARNQALPLFLVALCVLAAAYALVSLVGSVTVVHRLLTAIVLTLTGLMLFMGGRIIAPAVAGEFYRQGRSLKARVQPRIEGALIVAAAAAVLAALLRLDVLMRTACACAGVLAAVRLLRWQLWRCPCRADLLRLGAGYAWLVVGLLMIATTHGDERFSIAALHTITVGALGTLTFNVMANVTSPHSRHAPVVEPILTVGTLLIGGATIFRFAAAPLADRATGLLVMAAACWTVAFLALFCLLARAISLRAIMAE